ncbi:aminotransferase class V-fold PLP-dependent enzyme [Aliidiomarina haloalkalitolerans]|uniref:cysteine desulfurase n=1 Tax=Aliidiomarina haloalkalitolerans TaxID=859059 RepID=A0A432VXD3_9GAMM|nr:cysteine desulfurase [Aliidiomarina haloalkalitolerans]RUO21329.1 cysteine desulfurase CsdA [Aliidiomarina haloalkalitolerans]
MNLRSDFPLFQAQPDLVYLDSASSCQVPEVVVTAMADYLRYHHANVHRGNYQLSQAATAMYEAARERVAVFFNSSAAQVVFTKGTTDSLNLLAAGLAERVQAGDNVVVSLAEHHANFLPWQQLCAAKGAELRVIPLATDGTFANLPIDQRTRVVAVTHASNVLGVVNELTDITAAAQAVGAYVVVDAAQTAAHLTLEPTALGIDALAFSGHKVYGPTGIGALWLSPRAVAELPLYQVGGGIVRTVSATHSDYVQGVQRFEPGTPNLVGIAGLVAALDFLAAARAQGSHAYLRDLTQQLLSMLKDFPQLRLLPHGDGTIPVVSVTSDDPDVHRNDLAMLLDQQQIAARSGHHCAQPLVQHYTTQGCLRFSLGVYNQATDIQRLQQGLSKAFALLG